MDYRDNIRAQERSSLKLALATFSLYLDAFERHLLQFGRKGIPSAATSSTFIAPVRYRKLRLRPSPEVRWRLLITSYFEAVQKAYRKLVQ
jgi:hypothetical protein